MDHSRKLRLRKYYGPFLCRSTSSHQEEVHVLFCLVYRSIPVTNAVTALSLIFLMATDVVNNQTTGTKEFTAWNPTPMAVCNFYTRWRHQRATTPRHACALRHARYDQSDGFPTRSRGMAKLSRKLVLGPVLSGTTDGVQPEWIAYA